jgi:hypothetical protein
VSSVIARLKSTEAADEAARTRRAQNALRQLTGLTAHAATSLQARTDIAEGWVVWFKRAQPLARSKSWSPYANAYNLREIPVSEAVRAA